MSDLENPRITCTQRELALDAWQASQGIELGQRSSIAPHAFEKWWASVEQKTQGFIPSQRWSLRELIEAAWREARGVEGFDAYWKIIATS